MAVGYPPRERIQLLFANDMLRKDEIRKDADACLLLKRVFNLTSGFTLKIFFVSLRKKFSHQTVTSLVFFVNESKTSGCFRSLVVYFCIVNARLLFCAGVAMQH